MNLHFIYGAKFDKSAIKKFFVFNLFETLLDCSTSGPFLIPQIIQSIITSAKVDQFNLYMNDF